MTGQHTVEGYIKRASSYTHAGKADPAFPRPALNVAVNKEDGELAIEGVTIDNSFITNLREVTDCVSAGLGTILEVTTRCGDVHRFSLNPWDMWSVIHLYDPHLADLIRGLRSKRNVSNHS